MPAVLDRRPSTTPKKLKVKSGKEKGPARSAVSRAPVAGALRGKARLRAIPCDACGTADFKTLFEKESSRSEAFRLVSCRQCGLVHVNPQPNLAAVQPYYENHYFLNRTDRGYADYYSPEVRRSIIETTHLNLKDLDFYVYETRMRERGDKPNALDAGCAAGYFVDYLRTRGWNSRGIELSEDAARYGRDVLRLPIEIGDYLSAESLAPGTFDLITLWASIEHMHSPRAVLQRTHSLLRSGGRMILSTCRYGLLARVMGARWRYMNVPEHLYFFSVRGIERLAETVGFRVVKVITYGSGMTTRANATLFYRTAKRLADPLVKRTGQGDMMALQLEKV